MEDDIDDAPSDAPLHIELTDRAIRAILRGCGRREWNLLIEIDAIARDWPDGPEASISADTLARLAMGKLCWTRTKVDLALAALIKAGCFPPADRNDALGGQLSYRPSALIANNKKIAAEGTARLAADLSQDNSL